MLGNFSGFVVPIAEELPTQADSDAGFVAASDGIVTNVIPLKTNQFIVTIDTTEASTGNAVGVGSVRIALNDEFVFRIDRYAKHINAKAIHCVSEEPSRTTLVNRPPIRAGVTFPRTSVTVTIVIVGLEPT